MKTSVTVVFLAFLTTGLLTVAQENATNGNERPSLTAGEIRNTLTPAGKKDYVPLWLSRTKLGNSHIFESTAGSIGIGTTTPAATLDVNGAVNAATSFNLGGVAFTFGSASNQNAFLGFAGNATMTGVGNTASGVQALQSNTTGIYNTASGFRALLFNTTGYANTATGEEALLENTTGSFNTACGAAALQYNTTGSVNTALGYSALEYNTTASWNTAVGGAALVNTTGFGNTGVGEAALLYNTTGSGNTALGYAAGPDQNSTNLTNATAIGANAVVSESNALVLGGTGQYAVKVGIGTATPANVFTIAQGAGQAISDGWGTYSSQRLKKNVRTLHGALAKVQQLRGVSYDLKANGKHEVGVIAEEVGAVVPEVVSWDKDGKDAQGVDYGRLTALLIEATKEQQSLIRKQKERIDTQKAQIARLASEVKAIRASLRQTGRSESAGRALKANISLARQ